jgi:hypothetical protein
LKSWFNVSLEPAEPQIKARTQPTTLKKAPTQASRRREKSHGFGLCTEIWLEHENICVYHKNQLKSYLCMKIKYGLTKNMMMKNFDNKIENFQTLVKFQNTISHHYFEQ